MKKLNQQGFTHHLLILGIAVVVVAAVGFTGYKVYKGRNIEAKAASYRWTDLSTGSNGCGTYVHTVCVCKESVSTTSWKLRAIAVNKGQIKQIMGWNVDYAGKTVMTGTVQPGTSSNVHYTYVAKVLKGNVTGAVGWGQRGAGLSGTNITNVQNCIYI